MKRRDFLKWTAVSSAGLAIPGGLATLGRMAEAAQGPDLVVAKGASTPQVVRAALDAAGGMRRFIAKGDVVVLKPNIGWDRTPQYAATTNPDVVGALAKLCFEAGAKKVRVFDNTLSDARLCYKQSGIADAAAGAGAEMVYMDRRKYRDVRLNGTVLKSWPLYNDIFEADKVINIPIAKTHSLSVLTLAMKNWMGVMGGVRFRVHQRLDESLVDLCRVIKPTLTVLDAVRILTANGPTGGDLDDVKRLDTVVVGTDQVAIDSFGATLFGMKGSDLNSVKLAARAGLGVMDLSKLSIRRISV
ncbi:MAG: DUF362 domain-containing protein [Syntrophaceae bacterium]